MCQALVLKILVSKPNPRENTDVPQLRPFPVPEFQVGFEENLIWRTNVLTFYNSYTSSYFPASSKQINTTQTSFLPNYKPSYPKKKKKN